MSTEKCWVVVDVGCIECGVGTEVLGVFESPEEADKVASAQRARFPSFRDGGQHDVKIHETTLTPVHVFYGGAA
jgi:hypothetical protein